MNVNQRIIVATADGTIASKALSASLPSTINGMMTKAKNDTNIARMMRVATIIKLYDNALKRCNHVQF